MKPDQYHLAVQCRSSIRYRLDFGVCTGFLVLLLSGCVSSTVVSEPEPTALERNLEHAANTTSALDIAWRQPKIGLAGGIAQPLIRDVARGPDVVGQASSSPETLSTHLQAALEYSRAQHGLGLLVWHEGAIVAEDYRAGVNPAQHSATYSMHKSVLALTILAAIEDGVIESLETGVGRYLTQWSNDSRGAITFRQLLTHSSGLRSYSFSANHPKALALVYSDSVRETALTAELEYEPGARFDYSNFNSQIAGIALEAALATKGMKYATYLSQRIWQPIGASKAALWLEKPGGSARFFSGLEAAPEDWLRLGLLILNQGYTNGQKVLSPESIATLTTPSTLNPNYGLHVWLGSPWQAKRSYGPGTAFQVPHSAPYLADDVMFFDGFGGQRVYVIPSQQLVIARTGDPSFTWDDSILVNLVIGAIRDHAEVIHQERFDALRSATAGVGLATYSPLEPVSGATNVTELPRLQLTSLGDQIRPLSQDVLQSLREWGAANQSTGLMIWQDGRLLESRYFGNTSATTLINSRSLAKPLSVIVVGRAIEVGFIQSLDQPVTDFLPEWLGTDKATMSLRHLLQMRSGLEPQRFAGSADDIMNRAYLHPYHVQQIIDDYPLVNSPGERYDYANANSELIAPIIERATKTRYADWLSQEVLKPLGAQGGQIWVNRPRGVAHSGCCILLPMETWLRLSILLLNNGEWQGKQLLPKGFVEQMRTPTEQNPHAGMGVYVAGDYVRYRGFANPEIDYGKSLHSEPYLANDLFLFDGNGHQVSYIIPSHKLVILRVGSKPPESIVWDNAWLPNTVLRALAATTGVSLMPQTTRHD